MLLVLPAFVWVICGALVLFAALVAVRMTLDLVGRAKELAASARRASGRLNEAVGEVTAEAQKATKRLERMSDRKRRT